MCKLYHTSRIYIHTIYNKRLTRSIHTQKIKTETSTLLNLFKFTKTTYNVNTYKIDYAALLRSYLLQNLTDTLEYLQTIENAAVLVHQGQSNMKLHLSISINLLL